MTAACVVLIAAVVAGLLWWQHSRPSQSPGAWNPPPQILLPSMRAQPVTGWRLSAADLGLPPDTMFVTAPDVGQSKPLVGYLDDKAYFLASRLDDHDWWLVGIDVRRGKPLFPPVSLASNTVYRPDCYLNGPNTVLCLRLDGTSTIAWVIQAGTGTVTFRGPTTLTQNPGHNGVDQVGIYAIASEQGRGVSGIGNHAELTWFVGGHGDTDQRYRPQSDLGDPTIGTQVVGGPATVRKVAFSLADGTVLSPDLGPQRQTLDAVVYPGGFATEAGPSGRLADPDEVLFYDARAQQVGHIESGGRLATSSRDVPMIVTPAGTTVYTPRGTPLARISSDGAEPDTVLIGTRLMVNTGGGNSFPKWTQYDLRTGKQGPTCEDNFGNYLGSDGTVAVLRILDPVRGRVAKAVDLATCNRLWTLQAGVNSDAQVWRINTTLVQLSNDGTQLMSLVAP